MFKGYLKWTKQGSSFKAGTYIARPGDTYDNLITRLNAGDVVKEETVVFTIPEGYTAEQIAAKLGCLESGTCCLFKICSILVRGYGKLMFSGIPHNKKIRHRLEGYLFPETYELAKNSTPQEVVEAQLEQLKKKLEYDSRLAAKAEGERTISARVVDCGFACGAGGCGGS